MIKRNSPTINMLLIVFGMCAQGLSMTTLFSVLHLFLVLELLAAYHGILAAIFNRSRTT